ncbi:unnamed protein product [Echinostoma caproni]|uniref:Uncharacterized protein n=1 Tax=Echinostoma caproni TaxID=27848 RepID=A0A183BFX9_9TREM|nr:unnamed protein product [Echinostoma caproni]
MSNTGTPGSTRKHHATGHSSSNTFSGPGHGLHSPSHSADGSGWTGSGKTHRGDAASGGILGSALPSSPNPSGFDCPSWDLSNSNRAQSGGPIASTTSSGTGPCVWIDDGRLYCGQKW